MKDQNKYMIEALEGARKAAAQGEVPVGAVLVNGLTGEIIARAFNCTEQNNDPTAHAEILAIRQGGKLLGAPRLVDCDLYVTLEPCPMCAAAISFARIRRLYYGAYDPKSGGVEHGPRMFSHAALHHLPEFYGGIHESECGALMTEFFRTKR